MTNQVGLQRIVCFCIFCGLKTPGPYANLTAQFSYALSSYATLGAVLLGGSKSVIKAELNFFRGTQYLYHCPALRQHLSPYYNHTFMATYRFLLACCLVVLSFAVSSCDAIGSIFEAGAWTGLIAVFLVVLLIWFIVTKMRSR